ncbi:MAG TPA: maleylpyruvate isomerase N-terminal domain-containing protein, partial [Acidimicrobiales bacterium]|nr:maleylpyruvate isomerase N-terminal domain-containing protein [Acidimicrobiales bacterium]
MSSTDASDDPTQQDVLDRQISVLTASVRRLAALVEPLAPEQLRQRAYPTEWTVADVLSHLGSGATMVRLRLDGDDLDMPAIWDEWNAKSPDLQAADALRADRELIERLNSLSPEDRTRRFALGPMDLDLTSFLGLRITEHILHTWDVAVTLDETATVTADAAGVVVDRLGMIAGFSGKPTGTER